LLLVHALALAIVGGMAWLALNRSGFVERHAPFPGLTRILAAHVSLLRSGTPLLLAILFSCYTLQFLTMLTFLGQFLRDVEGWKPEETNAFMSAVSLITLLATLGSGLLVRWGVRLLVANSVLFSGLAMTAVAIFVGQPSSGPAILFMVIMMSCLGSMPGFIMAMVPQAAPTAERAALAFSAIALFGNVGTFSGTPAFAALFRLGGWPAGAAFVVATSVTAIALTAVVQRRLDCEAALG
jgi:predicted MFS family arabinose efflux permease